MPGPTSSHRRPLLATKDSWALSGFSLPMRLGPAEPLWEGGTETWASSLDRSRASGQRGHLPAPGLCCILPLLPKAGGILGVCPKAPVYTPTPQTGPRVSLLCLRSTPQGQPLTHSQEGFSKGPAPLHTLSLVPLCPGDQARSFLPGIQGSTHSVPTSPLHEKLKPCHKVPPDLERRGFTSPLPLPSQEPSCCLGCPSPSLA